MPREFEHFIITRFNLREAPWTTSTKDSAWMNERIDIFKNFTLPSLLNQSCKTFKWIVLFQPSTPEHYGDIIQELKQHRNFIPCFVDNNEMQTLVAAVKNEISKWVTPDTQSIITSRIDNDDAVHEDFVKIVQQNLKTDRDYVLNFTDGIGYSEGLYSISKRNKVNAFATIYEPYNDGDYKTVYCTTHPSLRKVAPVIHIHDKLMYLINFHGNNILNEHKFTTAIGRQWHYLLRYLCINFPALNNHLRYSYAKRIPIEEASLDKFHIKIS